MAQAPRDPLPFIDAVRGYAILLVITCHVTYAYPELPYPVHRLTALGWHGVQLFFLASAVTLLMSWHAERARSGQVDVRAFLLRRFFRIAPAYYLAALFFAWLQPPPAGFNVTQALSTLAFVNAWHPWMMCLGADSWNVVPGGWSVGVEFTFYFLFPIFAALATTLRRSLATLATATLFAIVANTTVGPWLAAGYPAEVVENFLYFWFPNQAPVFAAGGVLYHLLQHPGPLARPLRAWPRLGPGLALVGFFALAYVPVLHATTGTPPFVGGYLLACVPLGLFILALSLGGTTPFVNPAIRALGKVSFSAYLLHYAAIHLLIERMPRVFGVDRTGVVAIGAFLLGLIAVVLTTYAGARLAWLLIEEPGIALGKRLVRHLRG